MEAENTVSGMVPEYSINARFGSDLVTEKAMTWITCVLHIKPLGDHKFSVDGGIAILEDTPPGRKEMLQHGVKMVTQYH